MNTLVNTPIGGRSDDTRRIGPAVNTPYPTVSTHHYM